LLGFLIQSYVRPTSSKDAVYLEIAGLYWHFVDIVWIVIFTVVYLVQVVWAGAADMGRGSSRSGGTDILIVLILGAGTYVAFAVVGYAQAWLGQTWTMLLLAALSVVKFLLVVLFFMHLKGDDRMYSGFFSSGMVIALATFIAMTAMFILPRAMNYGEA